VTLAGQELREIVRLFASGVTIVTVVVDGEMHGMTASSFASVSLDPALILVSLDKTSRTRTMIGTAGSFAVNILGEGQEETARLFARSGDKKFEGLPHRVGPLGAPLLDGTIAWLECHTTEIVEAGDHDIFIAKVLAAGETGGRPLVYFDRSYRSLKDS
jgi:flavin reductase (DIM6/NTAB) family NADH-FMN oxidoreductase RutF